MNRGFWFVAGAASGVYGLVKAKRTAQNFTPDGIGARVAALGAGARAFAHEVQTGMAEREAEMHDQLRLPSGAAGQPRMIEEDTITPDHRQESLTDGHS